MEKLGLKWVGEGFLFGIPARDLTADEVKFFGKEKLLESGLYVEFTQEKSELEAHPNKSLTPKSENK